MFCDAFPKEIYSNFFCDNILSAFDGIDSLPVRYSYLSFSSDHDAEYLSSFPIKICLKAKTKKTILVDTFIILNTYTSIINVFISNHRDVFPKIVIL